MNLPELFSKSYHMTTLNALNAESTKKLFSFDFIKVLLRGSGQVMFQNNSWTGLFFLIGIFWGAYEEGFGVVAWAALVGLATSTLTGYILGLPEKEGEDGLWGFNGILVGCAFMTFLEPTLWTWLALILCSALTTWVRVAFNNVMGIWKVSSFTFPFVAMSWLFLMASREMNAMPDTFLPSPHLPTGINEEISLTIPHLTEYWLKGISQVFLINSWVTGIFFLIGLFISNKWAGIWAALASAVSLLVIILFRGPGTEIENGIFGFSAVLTGIAIGATFYEVNYRSALWGLIAVIVTVFVQAAMNIIFIPLGLPTLTGPFCIATWLFMLPGFVFHKEKEKTTE